MAKPFLLTSLLLISIIAGLTLAVDLKVNHDQVVTPIQPNLSHPLVDIGDNTAVHNPTNLSLSEQPKIGGAEENYTKVQTNVFDSSLFNFLWCRSFNQSIFALSIKGSVFTSGNHGNDWRNFNHEFEKASQGEAVRPHIVSMIQNEKDMDTIIFVSLTGAAWMTTDCGKSVFLIDNGRKFSSFKFHPHHAKQVLALYRKECSKKALCVTHNVLVLSEDAGQSWRPIKTFVYDYQWGKHADYAFGLGSNAIFITKQDDESADQSLSVGANRHGVSTYFSWDFFKTENRVIHSGYKFWLSKCCIYVEAHDPSGNRLVYTTEVWSNNFHWHRMHLIRNERENYIDFHVLNELSSFNPYLVATRESDSGIYLSDVYKADYSNANFTKILANLVTGGSNKNPSFQEVPSLQGLFFANVYDQNYLRVNQQISKSGKNNLGADLKNFVKTMVSFDDGQTWSHVRPPTHNMKNVPYDCEGCSLNLHLAENPNYPPLYGVNSAPGILIAVGSVGHYLSYAADDLSVFVSEDGGLSWRHVADGEHIYEIGDQGGLLVMSEYRKTTDTVKFSYDLGKTWFFVKFLDPSMAKDKANKNAYKAIAVSNIIIEPTNNNHQFLIVGTGPKTKKGYSAHLDFSEYHSRSCVGYDDPDGYHSDYTKFVPHTYENDKCFQGLNGYYIRKKPEAKCINPDHFDYFRIINYCKCTDRDWECDTGFSREPGSVVCTQNDDFTVRLDPPAVCDGTYSITNGYRKTSGSVCQGGVDHSPRSVRCPGSWGFIASFFFFIFKAVFYIAVLGGCFLLFSVGYRMYREKQLASQDDDETIKNVQFFDKKKDEKDPETKYASLPELNTSGYDKPSTIQDDFEADDEDI